MKVKLLILAGTIVVMTAVYSFQNAPQYQSSIALLNYQVGKDNDDNFVITYGDGKIEKTPFLFKMMNPQSRIDRQLVVANLYEKLAQNGYSFVGMGEGGNAVFQKK